MQPPCLGAIGPVDTFREVPAMQIRTQATFDGLWTVFVDNGLCISDLSQAAAEALVAALGRIDGVT